jgi:hypothetical protein
MKVSLVGRRVLLGYSEDQPRDDHGRWEDGGGSGGENKPPPGGDPKLTKVASGWYATEDGRWAVVGDQADVTSQRESGGTGVSTGLPTSTEWAVTHSPEGLLREDANRGNVVAWVETLTQGRAYVEREVAKEQALLDSIPPEHQPGDGIQGAALLGYSEDQARDDHGRWTEEGGGGGGSSKDEGGSGSYQPAEHQGWDDPAMARIAKETSKEGIDAYRQTGTQLDPVLGRIAEAQGFDGKPETLSSDAMNARVAAGWEETYIGSGNAARGGEIREGPYPTTITPYGNGLGASEDPYRALYYAGGNGDGVIRVAIDPEARGITSDELLSMRQGEAGLDQRTAFDEARSGATTMDQAFEGIGPGHWATDADPGRYAAARGYDYIRVEKPGPDDFVFLNRTALAVQDTPPSYEFDGMGNVFFPDSNVEAPAGVEDALDRGAVTVGAAL